MEGVSARRRSCLSNINYIKALELNPEFIKAYEYIGTTFALLDRPAEALKYFEMALIRNPTNADAHFNIGALLAGYGQYDKAVFHLQKTIELKPGDGKTIKYLEHIRRLQK